MHESGELSDRIVVLGRGGVGDASAASQLAELCARPLIRIDKHFWPVDRRPQPAPHWADVQAHIAGNRQWVLDADLGPFDIDEPRLGHPDEVWVLDFSPLTCLIRALRHPSERRDLRVWLFRWRREYLRAALAHIAADPRVRLRRFRTEAELDAALTAIAECCNDEVAAA